MPRTRYAQVGMGGRSMLHTRAIAKTYKESSELVGVCDINPGRSELASRKAAELGSPGVPAYHACDFDRMIAERKPDVVIVTTVDRFHDEYICRAMELGCDVITEKPMTIDEKRCQRIVDTAARTGRKLHVTFNYRYAPPNSQVKRLLRDGIIGRVLSVDFGWNLNNRHGADYYRRWHRNKANSGGLMVHKATHHFDLINWWLSTEPETVAALGRRAFYVPETADVFGLNRRTERCHTCPHKADGSCKFALDMTAGQGYREMYLEQEHYDGYFRDRCVFSDEIDIEDSMNLVVRYTNGVHMSYCLNSFLPWEGFRVMFNGVRGRLEFQLVETVYVSGDGSVPGETIREKSHIHVFPHFADAYNIPLDTAKGGHGGGDDRILADIFGPGPVCDDLRRLAGLAEGSWSILTGVAANISMARGGEPVHVPSLVSGIPKPNWTEMRES